MYETEESILSEVGKGWHTLVKELIKELFYLGWDGDLHQIKEKFGGLRFYIGKTNDALDKAIQRAEIESLSICERCGKPGRLRDEGWLLTLCDKCHDERPNRSRDEDPRTQVENEK